MSRVAFPGAPVPAPAAALVVSEVFGPTFQGEGPSLGVRAAFIRLGNCNLACAWCDTPYTWDWTGANGTKYDSARELRRMTLDELAALVAPMACGLVVITGGEPMLQQRKLPALIATLRELGPVKRIEVETNGTIVPLPEVVAAVDQFNVSPKLRHSGDSAADRVVPPALAAYSATGKAVWKFVCRSSDDIAELLALPGVRGPVYVMPEGRTQDEIESHMRVLATAALEHPSLNLTTRLHVALWGDTRGH